MWATARASPNENRSTKPTPLQQAGKHGEYLAVQAAQALWPTTTTRDYKDGAYNPSVPINSLLGRTVWPTPQARDHFPAHSPEYVAAKKAQGHGMSNLNDVVAATYPTPSASGFEAKDPVRLLERRAECKERTGNGNGFGLTLGQFATIESSNGSLEPTEKRGALNPEFVCWLMGYPTEHLSSAPMETRSTSARPRRSSKPRSPAAPEEDLFG
jgi:hypothetical protein